MKLRLKKLNQRGFDHVMLVVGFVVVFAVIGAYVLIKDSHAATPEPTLHYASSTSTTCLDEAVGGLVDAKTCNGNVGQKYGIKWSNSTTGQIELNASCVAPSGATRTTSGVGSQLKVVACGTAPGIAWGGVWTIHGSNSSGYWFSNVHAGSSYCMTVSGSSVVLSTGCGQRWFYNSGFGSTTTGGGSGSGAVDCYTKTWQSGQTNQCVTYLQTMVKYGSGSQFTVSGTFDASTVAAVKRFQGMGVSFANTKTSLPPISVTGKVDSATWGKLCSDVFTGANSKTIVYQNASPSHQPVKLLNVWTAAVNAGCPAK